MIKQLSFYDGTSFNPHNNLALEKHLMDITKPGTCLLYLWQNQNTVVIGRNQNPWLECRTGLLEQEGGTLARRLSGGGAVFHDLGNLNFTFIMCKEDYNLDKQLSVIETACGYAGVSVERSGRNDILAEGRKFSGNAFYQNQTHAYHHGTLMVDVDRQKLGRYLSPPKAKLEAKGIASVRSRVVNLKELAPDLTIDAMKTHMVRAFCQVYRLPVETLVLTSDDLKAVDQLKAEYSSWEYLFGTPLPFTFQCESHFQWGHISIQLDAKDGIIKQAKVYSDSMDWTLPAHIEDALTGCRFETGAMQNALTLSPLEPQIALDLCQMLTEQHL